MKPLVFAEISQFSKLSDLLIFGYYINGAGQSTLYLGRNKTGLIRVPMNYHKNNPTILALSLLCVKNSNSFLCALIDNHYVQGEYINFNPNLPKPTKADIKIYTKQALLKGYVGLKTILKNPVFKKWKSTLNNQIQQIINDRNDFQKDSEYKEGLYIMKNTLNVVNKRNKLGPEILRKLLDQSYDEHFIEGIFNS